MLRTADQSRRRARDSVALIGRLINRLQILANLFQTHLTIVQNVYFHGIIQRRSLSITDTTLIRSIRVVQNFLGRPALGPSRLGRPRPIARPNFLQGRYNIITSEHAAILREYRELIQIPLTPEYAEQRGRIYDSIFRHFRTVGYNWAGITCAALIIASELQNI